MEDQRAYVYIRLAMCDEKHESKDGRRKSAGKSVILEREDALNAEAEERKL